MPVKTRSSSSRKGMLFDWLTADEFCHIAAHLQPFQPAAVFAGRRDGWVFKRGEFGMGYYPSAPPPIVALLALGASCALLRTLVSPHRLALRVYTAAGRAQLPSILLAPGRSEKAVTVLEEAVTALEEAVQAVQAVGGCAGLEDAQSNAVRARTYLRDLCWRRHLLRVVDPISGVPHAADEGGAPLPAALSLACIGCARLPSDMDNGREKHPICDMCRDEKLPTTYSCGIDCPANPSAWVLHGAFHKELKHQRKAREDCGARQQRAREVAEEQALSAAQSGDEYSKLVAKGLRYDSKQDWRRAVKAYRDAIALRLDEPTAYYNLGAALSNSGHFVEAAQRYLETKERYLVGSEHWAAATAAAFDALKLKGCDGTAKPEWWTDEGLKALSARVVGAAPNDEGANGMRAFVLSGVCGAGAWEVGHRSATELMQAVAHCDRALARCDVPAGRAKLESLADWCRSQAETK